jgi:radical SAM superfamily enzyme YgiQ (UPF0313 family)
MGGKTKILMVYPKSPENTFWSYKYTLRLTGKKALMPPLGLMTVAAMLPERYSVKLVDLNITELKEDDILSSDIVFISAMIIQRDSFSQVVGLCNQYEIPVVAGGPYPTALHNSIEGVDYFVLNEAEVTLPRFIQDFEKNCAKKIYFDETKPDLKETPPPRFDLIDVNQYQNMTLQFSRGCPFNCEFCDIIEMFGRKIRSKLPSQFISEMECLYETGFRGPIFIVDDNFIGNKRTIRELLNAIIEWQKAHSYPFSLFTETSINLAEDEELLDLMKKAGFNSVFIGIESPDVDVLKTAQKNQNVRRDMLDSVRKIQSKGLQVVGGFIVGLDGEPQNIFDLQIDFIEKAGIPIAMVGLLIVLPNTQLFRRLKSENRILYESGGNNTFKLELNYIPRMPEKKLMEGYIKIVSEIYKPGNYFRRCLTLLKKLPKENLRLKSLGFKKFIILLSMSLTKQSFSFYGLHYLLYLGKALWYNPKNFIFALQSAVRGDHFIRIRNDFLNEQSFPSEAKKR